MKPSNFSGQNSGTWIMLSTLHFFLHFFKTKDMKELPEIAPRHFLMRIHQENNFQSSEKLCKHRQISAHVSLNQNFPLLHMNIKLCFTLAKNTLLASHADGLRTRHAFRPVRRNAWQAWERLRRRLRISRSEIHQGTGASFKILSNR